MGIGRRSGLSGRGGGGGGVPSLTPIGGAVAWYRGSGAGASGWVNDGTAGAAGNLVAIGTAASLSSLDGNPVVDFANANAGFGCASTAFTLGASHTIYVICRTPADFAAVRRVISGGVGAAGAGTSILQCSTTPTWQISTIDMGATPAANTWYGVIVQYNASGTDELLFVNDFATPTQAATAAGASTGTGLSVGSHSTGVNDWLGMVAEVVAYTGTHDAAQRATMRSYFDTKFPSLSLT